MRKATLKRPNDPDAHIQFIAALLEGNQISAAESASRRALKKFPDSAQISVLRAEILAKTGKFQPARHILQKLISRTSDLAVAYLLLGVIDCEQNLDEDAISHFETAMQIEPNNHQASFFAAQLYLKKLAYDDAERTLKQTLSSFPGHIEALKSLGELMVKTNQYKEAIGFLREVLALSQMDAQSASFLIQAEAIADDPKVAVATAAELKPFFMESISVWEAEIFAFIRAGAYEDAIKSCDLVIAKTTSPTTAIAYKASALVQAHRDDAASECLALDRYVFVGTLPIPKGYVDINAFNASLVSQISENESLADHASNRSLINASDTLELFTGEETGAVKALRTSIRMFVENYIATLDDAVEHPFIWSKPAEFRIEAWANVYTRSGKQLAHFHPPAYLSGVYYPKVPENLTVNSLGEQEGALQLGRSYYRLQATREVDVREIMPAGGSIIVFPGYVGHNTVPIMSSEETRVSVAFNVIAH